MMVVVQTAPSTIESLDISPRIEHKIQVKHGINADDLRWHLVCNSRLLGSDGYYSAWSLRTAQVTSQIPIVGR